MKAFAWFVFLIALISCENDEVPQDCIDPSKKEAVAACYFVFRPVCGCNGVTYSNDCFAKADGVQIWAEGECGK